MGAAARDGDDDDDDAQWRNKLLLSTLTGRQVTCKMSQPMQEHHTNFVRLLEKMQNGCSIKINETGTSLLYRPGLLIGGTNLVHDCGTSRAIGYYLEPLLVLALFAKTDLSITCRGITNGPLDMGVDTLRTVSLPLLRLFGVNEGAQLSIKKRGAPPEGGGEVVLQIPALRHLSPTIATDPGRIKRIRGIAYVAKVAPQVANRIVESSRGVLNHFLPDVWIYTDVVKGAGSGSSPGFAVTLVAESTSGSLLSCEVTGAKGLQPEDVGAAASAAMLEEIRQGGVVDATHQSLVLLLMSLCPEDVSRIRLGPLTPFSESTLRLIREHLGLTFQIKADDEDDSLILSCRGSNIRNMSMRTT